MNGSAEYRDEIELMDYLNIFWKRKWIIILPSLLFAILAFIISLLLPKKWEVDTLIQPSRIFIQKENGSLEEVFFEDPRQISSQINKESYHRIIAAELNLNLKKFPKLEAQKLPETNLVHVSLRTNDVEEGKSILNSLFNLLKKDLDSKAEIEIKEIEAQINSNEIEKARLENEIKILVNKLKITKKRMGEIETEINEVNNRIKKLEKEQFTTLRRNKKNEAENLALLLYSNEIQQSLRYLNDLKELLNGKKVEEENLNTEIEQREKGILQKENIIKRLLETKGRISYSRLIKAPTPSLNPVFPRKKLITAIAFFVALIIFIFLALFIEYVEKHKIKA